MNSDKALKELLTMDFNTVLDIGSGDGVHARQFEEAGRAVTTISLENGAEFRGDYLKTNFRRKFDCIWASHVLEHQRNVGLFLDKCFRDLKVGGILAVTVPPMKNAVVGGHLSCFNAGILLYNLILAGFDCSEAWVKTYGYNCSVIVRKKKATMPELKMDSGDIETLTEFFPFEARQGFDGRIEAL